MQFYVWRFCCITSVNWTTPYSERFSFLHFGFLHCVFRLKFCCIVINNLLFIANSKFWIISSTLQMVMRLTTNSKLKYTDLERKLGLHFATISNRYQNVKFNTTRESIMKNLLRRNVLQSNAWSKSTNSAFAYCSVSLFGQSPLTLKQISHSDNDSFSNFQRQSLNTLHFDNRIKAVIVFCTASTLLLLSLTHECTVKYSVQKNLVSRKSPVNLLKTLADICNIAHLHLIETFRVRNKKISSLATIFISPSTFRCSIRL